MPKFTAQKILFDLDGTLVDTAADLHAATNYTLMSIDRAPVTLDQVRNMTGYGAIRLIERGLDATGGTEGLDLEALRQTFLGYYRRNICVHSQVFPGATAVLEELSNKGFKLAVCTNKPYAMANALLGEIGILKFFDTLTGGDTFDFKKPDPRHLTETAKRLEGAGNIVMIGDSTPDIKGAQNAGVPVIAVDFGYPDVPIETHAPDAIISSLSALPELLTYESA